jgi:polyhydroxybutyrate depolymerase
MVVADLIQRGIAEPKHIYLAGNSNGGIMAVGIMCLDAGPFSGLALMVASMTDQASDSCRPSKPMPAVLLFGTADVVVPYRGGPLPLAPPEGVLSADRLVLFFRKLNGCQDQSARSVRPGQQQVEIERWTRCTGGPVQTLRYAGGTHLSTQRDVHAGRMMLDFFRQIPTAKSPGR